MKAQFKILLVCMLFANILFAQSTVKGFVKDAEQQGVFFATVALCKQDSSILKATTTEEDGSYTLDGIKAGNYFLRVIMLGFQDSEYVQCCNQKASSGGAVC